MLEVCVDSTEGVVAAARGGADFIELCSSLPEGGLTPSAGLVRESLRMCGDARLNVMIRCRAGSDFYYSQNELETMLADIDIYKNMGVHGFVFGALTASQEIDRDSCSQVVKAVGSLPVTFHRAFDVCRNPIMSLQLIMDLGFSKLLTSGQCASACDPEAVMMIRKLVKNANGQVTVMPGAGVTDSNVYSLVDTGAKIFHSSCKVQKVLPVVNAPAMGTGGASVLYKTDENKVRLLKNAIKKYLS